MNVQFDWHGLLHEDNSNSVTLCQLSPNLVELFGCSDDRVYLHPNYAQKFLKKHRLTLNQLELLPICISSGLAVQPYRPRAMSFLLETDFETKEIFHAVIKVTMERHELWVTTFHKIRPDEYERLLKNGIIERTQNKRST